MRLTPAQIGVWLICGHNLPIRSPQSLCECIKAGHDMLTSIVGVDYAYDLKQWHDHLKETRQGGYTWNRRVVLPRIMAEALASEEWHAAVSELTQET